MKKILFALIILISVVTVNAQNKEKKDKNKAYVTVNVNDNDINAKKDEVKSDFKIKETVQKVHSNYKNFGFGVDVFYNLLPVKPLDINGNPMKDGANRGTNVYGVYRFKVGVEPLRIYLGLGISSQNFYFKSVYGSIYNDNKLIGTFIPLPDKSEGFKYKYSKMSNNYVYIPVGLNFKTNGGFVMSLGAEVGINIDNHTKYIGQDIYVENGKIEKVAGSSGMVNIKRKDIRNVNLWRFAATFRIGYKWINAFCSYQINSTFKADLGPKMNPLSIGITIQPF